MIPVLTDTDISEDTEDEEMILAEAEVISNLLVINDMPAMSPVGSAMTFHDEQVPEVSMVEEVSRYAWLGGH